MYNWWGGKFYYNKINREKMVEAPCTLIQLHVANLFRLKRRLEPLVGLSLRKLFEVNGDPGFEI